VNVYSKCDLTAKRRLWERILEVKEGLGDGLWCLVEDFNSVRTGEERRGRDVEVSYGQRKEMNFFSTIS
jgi:hypothetical protein